MNNDSITYYRLTNRLHTLLLLFGMMMLLSFTGWLIAGFIGIIWAVASGALVLLITPRIPSRLLLNLYGARSLPAQLNYELTDITQKLIQNSTLTYYPAIYYLPGSALMAFSVGNNKDTAIAISSGLLKNLNLRELTAVLAHEIAHIQSNDLLVMKFAIMLSRMTDLMALTGYVLILLYIPIFIFDKEHIPWVLFIFLITAPTLSTLMLLGLSRTREFNADMQAIKLTGDPAALISALTKINNFEINWFSKILFPGINTPNYSILRTHPLTDERIKRLREMR